VFEFGHAFVTSAQPRVERATDVPRGVFRNAQQRASHTTQCELAGAAAAADAAQLAICRSIHSPHIRNDDFEIRANTGVAKRNTAPISVS